MDCIGWNELRHTTIIVVVSILQWKKLNCHEKYAVWYTSNNMSTYRNCIATQFKATQWIIQNCTIRTVPTVLFSYQIFSIRFNVNVNSTQCNFFFFSPITYNIEPFHGVTLEIIAWIERVLHTKCPRKSCIVSNYLWK